MKAFTKPRVLAALVALAVSVPVVIGTTSSASSKRLTQHAAVTWHAQSGKSGDVSNAAQATLVRTGDGVRYRIDTTDLVPGNAYTVWFVVINDPGACDATPCAAPQLIGDPSVDGQVTWGLDGEVARSTGHARFKSRVEAGPLLDGWLQVQGLDDPMGAEIHLVLNDHGPLIDEMRSEMLSTYRAGCSDASPFPAFFPPTALADGEPGPNTCRLYQTAVFQAPTGN